MATVLVDVRPLQYSYSDELPRLQVQRPSAQNKSNDSASAPDYTLTDNSPQNTASAPANPVSAAPDEFSSAMETANALMAETEMESTGYLGTQLNVYA